MRALILLSLACLTPLWAINIGAVGYEDYYRNRDANAMKSYREGLKQAHKLADRKKEVVYLSNIATLFAKAGQADSFATYIAQAKKAAAGSYILNFITDLNASLFTGTPLSVDDVKLAAYADSLTVYELASIHIAAGRIHTRDNDPDKAIPHFKKAQDILEKDKKTPGYANAIFYEAEALGLKNDSKALSRLAEAEQMFRKGEFVRGIQKCMRLQIEILTKLGRSPEAEAIRIQLERM